MKVTKKLVQTYVKMQLTTNSAWALKALRTIFEQNQTEDEQSSGYAKEYNGIGFTGFDSEILSSMATQYIRRGELTPKQMKVVMNRMSKYSQQVIELSNESSLRAQVLHYATK